MKKPLHWNKLKITEAYLGLFQTFIMEQIYETSMNADVVLDYKGKLI